MAEGLGPGTTKIESAAIGKARFARMVLACMMTLACALLFAFTPWSALPAAAQKPARNILFLFAFEHNVPSYHMVERGVRQVLEADPSAKTVFFSEHMDFARFPEKAYRESLVDRYRQKYAGKKIDLIIALNSPALDFLTQHSEQIFSGVPVVFSLMLKGEIDKRNPPPNVTGVADTPDFTGTLELALKLLPRTQRVAVISGGDDADKGFEDQVRMAYEPYRARLEFIYLSGLPMDALLRETAKLPKHTIIIYSSIYKDGAGRAFVPIEALRLISPAANAPVFGAWNPFLGNGAVGGSVADLEQSGLDVGRLALDILQGGPGRPLPEMRQGRNTVMVDWRQMKRWDLSADSLPPGSMVKFQERDFWDLYKWEAAGVISFVLLESMLVGILLAQRTRRLRAEEGLRQANEKLELRVQERTADLQKANQLLWLEMDERRRAEEALRESEEKLRVIFDTMNAGIILVDPTGKIIFANRRMAEMFGCALDQLIGSNYAEHTHSSESEEARRKMRQLIDGTVDHVFLERTYQRLDGSAFWGQLSGRRLFHPDGSFWALVGVIHDINEQKLAQEQHARLEAQLRQSQKMEAIGTLAGGIAHDFNNILGAVVGYAEMALEDVTAAGKVDSQDIQQILRAAERAKGLVRQILAYSRKVEYNLGPLNLNKSIKDILPMLERALPKMVGIETSLASDLLRVNADPNQLDQIIMNLASNASDAMSEGGRLVIATANVVLDEDFCRQRQEVLPGRYVQLEVSDTGQGMAGKVRERIFDPFYTTKEIGKGTGLGLSTVYGIVKGHGGHIYCYSEPGLGTTFKIYFPALQNASRESALDVEPRAAPSGGAETILLVDDEEPLRQLGSKTLAGMGYKVVTARSGEEALEIYRGQVEGVDLVVMDLGMPGMGGHKAMQAILGLDPGAKVIIASGYSAQGRAKGALEGGAAGYVAKPYKRADLLATVRSVLDEK